MPEMSFTIRQCAGGYDHAIERSAPQRRVVAVPRLVVGADEMAVFYPSGVDREDLQPQKTKGGKQPANRLCLPELRFSLERIKKEKSRPAANKTGLSTKGELQIMDQRNHMNHDVIISCRQPFCQQENNRWPA